MLKILPIQSKDEQKEYCERCRIAYRPEALAYAATVDDAFVGICQFSTAGEVGELFDLVLTPGTQDFEAIFIMGRAALNFIDLCGVHKAICRSENADDGLLRSIGFSLREDGVYEMDLTDFFLHPCAHHCDNS